MRRSIALVLAVAGVAGCAPTDGAAPASRITANGAARQCFQPDRITNYTQGETDQIYVRTLAGGVFSVRTGGCLDAGSANALSITNGTGVGSQLCVGDSARIAVPSGRFGPNQCLGRVDRSLTQADVDALPSRFRP